MLFFFFHIQPVCITPYTTHKIRNPIQQLTEIVESNSTPETLRPPGRSKNSRNPVKASKTNCNQRELERERECVRTGIQAKSDKTQAKSGRRRCGQRRNPARPKLERECARRREGQNLVTVRKLGGLRERRCERKREKECAAAVGYRFPAGRRAVVAVGYRGVTKRGCEGMTENRRNVLTGKWRGNSQLPPPPNDSDFRNLKKKWQII